MSSELPPSRSLGCVYGLIGGLLVIPLCCVLIGDALLYADEVLSGHWLGIVIHGLLGVLLLWGFIKVLRGPSPES